MADKEYLFNGLTVIDQHHLHPHAPEGFVMAVSKARVRKVMTVVTRLHPEEVGEGCREPKEGWWQTGRRKVEEGVFITKLHPSPALHRSPRTRGPPTCSESVSIQAQPGTI